ncbi:velvet factor-domain-containing protein [Gaertneriomyces semiglobifer]|nr:velvet factor-domain-containing protein [Gaertneriomyces semiglobifer]
MWRPPRYPASRPYPEDPSPRRDRPYSPTREGRSGQPPVASSPHPHHSSPHGYPPAQAPPSASYSGGPPGYVPPGYGRGAPGFPRDPSAPYPPAFDDRRYVRPPPLAGPSMNGPPLPGLASAGALREGEKRFELRIRQQPVRARMSGFGNSDRRPVDPPPILEVIAFGNQGLEPISVEESCHLVVHATLWSADGKEDRNIVVSPYYYITRSSDVEAKEREVQREEELKRRDSEHSSISHNSVAINNQNDRTPSETPTPTSPMDRNGKKGKKGKKEDHADEPREMVQTLVGTAVSSCLKLEDLDGREGYYFVFHDLSIRTPGFYRMKFALCSVGGNNASPTTPFPVLATITSEVVQVFQPKKFPGLLTTTPLSECFAKQGVPIHVRKGKSQ